MFGGFTAVDSVGAWRDESTGKIYHEPGRQYLIAMEDSRVNRDKLESLAAFYGHMSGQITVMVTHADGAVSFVDVAKVATVNAKMCAE